MILPDINLLLYAYNRASPFHAGAVSWWQSALRGHEPVGLAPVVALGFVRLITRPGAFPAPLPPGPAIAAVASWLHCPPVVVLDDGGPERLCRVFQLLEACGTAGNLTSDAQIAALALEHHAVVHTADADFSRFPGVRWRNPLRH